MSARIQDKRGEAGIKNQLTFGVQQQRLLEPDLIAVHAPPSGPMECMALHENVVIGKVKGERITYSAVQRSEPGGSRSGHSISQHGVIYAPAPPRTCNSSVTASRSRGVPFPI